MDNLEVLLLGLFCILLAITFKISLVFQFELRLIQYVRYFELQIICLKLLRYLVQLSFLNRIILKPCRGQIKRWGRCLSVLSCKGKRFYVLCRKKFVFIEIFICLGSWVDLEERQKFVYHVSLLFRFTF